MKKTIGVICLFLFSVSLAYSIDTEKARKAIAEYSYLNTYSYIPVLVDYGFTERQIKSWVVTGTYLGWYLQQLAPLLTGYGTPNPDIAITTIQNTGAAVGELSARDMANMERFIRDMADAAMQLRDAALAERNTRQTNQTPQAMSGAEQKRIDEVQAQYQDLVNDLQAAREKTNREVKEHFEKAAEQEKQNEAERQLWEETKKAQSSPPTATVDTIVYITKSGEKYHRDGCRYLRKSKIQTTLGVASKIYTPCSVCRPPVLQ